MFSTSSTKEHSLSTRAADEFECIFYKCYRQVYRIVRNQTGSKEVAEEILHQIFSSLWEQKDSLTIKEPIEHYLNRAAKLRVINYFRDEARREKHLQRATEDYSYTGNYPEQAINYRELCSEGTASVWNRLNQQSQQLTCGEQEFTLQPHQTYFLSGSDQRVRITDDSHFPDTYDLQNKLARAFQS
ncbi:MAG: sigma factor [Bacteroidota bacterium]